MKSNFFDTAANFKDHLTFNHTESWVNSLENISFAIDSTQDNLDCLLIGAKISRVVEQTRNSVEIYKSSYSGINFDRLLKECDYTEQFIYSGCLDFGLDVMSPIIALITLDFGVALEIVIEALENVGDNIAANSLKRNLDVCEEIRKTCSPMHH